MGIIQKILTFIFITLLAVTVFEIGYLFLYRPIRSANLQNSNPPTVSQSQPQTVEAEDNQAISENNIDLIKKLKAGALVSAILNIQEQGEIVDVSKESGNRGDLAYEAILRFKDKNGVVSSFYYSANDLKNMKVFENNSRKTIRFEDLKPGDKVTVKNVVDLTKDVNSNVLEIEINRI